MALLRRTLLRNLVQTEENLFCKDQHYMSMDVSEPGEDKGRDTMVTGTKGEANLLKSCTETHSPCPQFVVEKFLFKIDKQYQETRLQLPFFQCCFPPTT